MVHSFPSIAMASLISAAVAAVTPELAVRQSSQCSSLHLMVAGGCSKPCATDGLSLLSTTVAGITSEIANSDLYLVPYDGSDAQAAVSGPLLNQAIAQYTQDCPNTPIVLLGYSLGGIITTNSLCGQVPYNPNIIAAVTYGEETFAYPASYDRGTCRSSAPLYARTNTAACAPFAPIMRSYCDAQDPNCCTGGNDLQAHFAYASKYDADVAAYVLSQYNAFGGSTTATSPSTTGPTTSPLSTTTFSTAPYYPNATIPLSSITSSPVGPGSPGSPGMPLNTLTTETVVIGVTTTIPLFEPTGLTTPSIITTGAGAPTFVPVSAVVEPVGAPTGGAFSIVPVGAGSGIAIAPSAIPTVVPSAGGIGSGSGPVGTGSPFNTTAGLTPFNPNAASSLAMPGWMIACALLALGLLL